MSIKPKLGPFDLTMIVVGLVIGMGIFRTPISVARETGTPSLFFMVWVLGGLVTLCGALTYAEIGSRYPVAGGFYKVLSYGFHPAYSFMINWTLLISNAASIAAVCIVGAEYIGPVLLPETLSNESGRKAIAIGAVLVLYLINLSGIRMSASWQNVLTVFKITLVLLLCLAAFSNNVAPPQANVSAATSNSWAYIFGAALVPVFFTYGGYQQTINFGSDVREPARNMPRAIMFGIAIILLLYITVNYAYVKVIGFEQLKTTDALAARMAGAFFGEYGFKITSVLLFLSVLGYANVNLMSNPRMYYAMAEDGVLPGIFKRVNSKTQVQEVALTVFAALVIGLLYFLSNFDNIIRYVMLFDSIGLASAAATIFVLRKKTAHLDGRGIYKMKLYPFVPAFFILVYLFVTVNIFIKDPGQALGGMIWFVAGLPIYFFMKYVVRKKE
ncbi:APC family permease [Chitinophaga sp. GCM10012297]|uniref:Amino acid permease n=1 Tax=Chitinophaga chungangae TaxID=2821488 RepID=A0ABS3YF35_9BACT|nr:amino acid permease [Chitinophaga chungangae]MBO9153306.1 amino acid permease [Chitinophaga chungangae]